MGANLVSEIKVDHFGPCTKSPCPGCMDRRNMTHPSCLSPWPTKVSGAWQEPSGTLCQCQKTAHCGKKPQYTYVYLLYALYTPNCLKQFPNATKNNPHDRTWRNHDKSYSLKSVSLQTCLGKDSSLESQQLSILHTLMATVRKFLLTN